MSQLALPLRLADHAVFASFLNAGNETLVATLVNLADGGSDSGCWLWGPAATGKTHLLQAVCDRAGDRSVYVPLAAFVDADPQLLDGLASRHIVCLDDIDAIAGDAGWENALFALCNQILDARGCLLVAARTPPRTSTLVLPDLVSRLTRLPIFQVQTLNDEQLAAALQLRARHRGLDLPAETASFLLSRSRRDMANLYSLLDKLDTAALKAQRRLTIPFVKSVLESS